MTHLFCLYCPAALDAIVTPGEVIRYTPLGPILACILITAVTVVTVLLIRRFFGKKKK